MGILARKHPDDWTSTNYAEDDDGHTQPLGYWLADGVHG